MLYQVYSVLKINVRTCLCTYFIKYENMYVQKHSQVSVCVRALITVRHTYWGHSRVNMHHRTHSPAKQSKLYMYKKTVILPRRPAPSESKGFLYALSFVSQKEVSIRTLYIHIYIYAEYAWELKAVQTNNNVRMNDKIYDVRIERKP